MAILVTGGAGFIGSNFILNWFAEESSQHEALINVDKLTYAGNAKNLIMLEGNRLYKLVVASIADSATIEDLLQKHSIRAVINFAAESHVDRSIHSPRAFVETNVLGTQILLDSVLAYWRSLSTETQQKFCFLHVSTDEVYGTLASTAPAFNERNPYQPNSPYAASKAASDHLVRAYHHTYGLPTLTTNCSNNYGPYQFPEKLIPLMLVNALAGKPLPIYGDGKQVRDWLYVKDHCSAINTVLAKGRRGECYNIGGDSEMTNIDLVTLLCQILDKKKPRTDGKSYAEQISFVKDRPGHDRRYAIDASKIKSELNWIPHYRFAQGLTDTVDWYLDNATWIEEVKSGSYREWIQQHYGLEVKS